MQGRGRCDAAIRQWWQRVAIAPDAQWCTLGPNCSTTVANALKAGGADRYVSFWQSWNAVWKPDDVLRYALAIRAELAKPNRAGAARH